MTAAKAEPKGLHAKLAEVMAEADRIPKNGRAPAQMGGFEFVQVGDAADAIRKALGTRGVSMLPSNVEIVGEAEHQTRSGGTMTTQTVRTTWTLVDGETGQTATIQSLGTGADSGDKFSPKAQTNAMKYALLMGFLLSTGDDPETQDASDRGARRSSPPAGVPPTGNGASSSTRSSSTGGGEDTATETEVVLGPKTVTGRIAKGDGKHSNLEWQETADGHHIGFRLITDAGAIPQVIVAGALGRALFVLGEELAGRTVEVTGEAVRVDYPGRRPYQRLYVKRIVTDEWTLPAEVPASDSGKVDDLDSLPW